MFIFFARVENVEIRWKLGPNRLPSILGGLPENAVTLRGPRPIVD